MSLPIRAWIRVFVLLLPMWGTSAHSREEPEFPTADFSLYCAHVYFEKGFDPRLRPMETRLICGDPQQDRIGKPWSDIPASQARFFLSSFLQSRGFHDPRFSIDADRLYVRPGPQSKMHELQLSGAPSGWKIPRKRGYRGKALTPTLLDQLEGWTLNELKVAGYACAEVRAIADPGTGLTKIEIDPGDRKRVLAVEDEKEFGLHVGVLDRHSAYRVGDFYSERQVQLTRRRLLEEGLLEAVSFSTECLSQGVILHRDPMVGPPREIRIGAGGNTDDGLRLRMRAKQIRIGPDASSAEAGLDASFRRQEATLSGRYYYSRSRVRDFLEPTILFERLDDPVLESRAWKISVRHGWNREFEGSHAELLLGPSWQISEILDGVGPRESTIVFLDGSLRWQDHEHEYFETSPREGKRFSLDWVQTQEHWGATFTASRARIRGQMLWNALNDDPPLLVLGVRGSLGTTWTDRDLIATDLPVQFRFFAGGTDDLRGFDRRTLPRESQGGSRRPL